MTIPRRRSRVLVVEDIPTLRRAYQCLLERNGYDVSIASNGGAALAMLDVLRPEVVVTEVAMPVMDGITLLRAMRQRNMPAPVLMLADDEFLRGLALHAGADRFLAQPISPDELLDAVAVLARQERSPQTDRRDTA